MKQIDLGPEGYKVQDRNTGRWVQRADKRMCRILSIAGLAFLAWFAIDGDIGLLYPAFYTLGGFFVGSLFTISLKSLDW